MKLIGCGDSWAWGAELVKTQSNSTDQMCDHNDHYITENMEYRLSNRYLKVFADKVGISEILDLSLASYSNEAIYRSLIRYLAIEGYLSGRDTSDLFISIGWTSPERKEHGCVDDEQYFSLIPSEFQYYNITAERWMPVGPWIVNSDYKNEEINDFFKYYLKYFWTDFEMIYKWISIIKNTENLLKLHNIKYVMHQAFFHYRDTTIGKWDDNKYKTEIIDKWTKFEQAIFNSIDNTHFVDKNVFVKTFHHYVLEQADYDTTKVFRIFHPNAYAHKLWAEHQYDFCIKNNLL